LLLCDNDALEKKNYENPIIFKTYFIKKIFKLFISIGFPISYFLNPMEATIGIPLVQKKHHENLSCPSTIFDSNQIFY
jgi:hypothetical protein